MKKNHFVLALLLVLSLTIPSRVWGWGASGGDGTRYAMLQETAVFINNSGAALSAGDVVILDTTATAGTTLGAYVTTTTSADDDLVIGVVTSASTANGLPVVVVTRGPVDTRCNEFADDVASGDEVGSDTKPKNCGGGPELGLPLEDGSGLNEDLLFVWVDKGVD